MESRTNTTAHTIIVRFILSQLVKCLFSQIMSVGSAASWNSISWPRTDLYWAYSYSEQVSL